MLRSINLSYKKLLNKTKDLIILQTVQSIIQWDMETMMPPKAVEQRSYQLALLSRMEHKISTSPEMGRLINEIKSNANYETLDQIKKRNFHLIKKNYEEQTQLPEKLVSETTRQQVLTVNSWKKAKASKDYSRLKPDLDKLIDLNKKVAEILMKVKKTSTPYNALIDNYEPKTNTQTISKVFAQLQSGIKKLLIKIQDCPGYKNKQISKIQIPVEKQRKIAQLIAKSLGYDVVSTNSGGRIDETEHPFTTGYYDDVRITTHFHPNNYISAILSVLHETGHALYEQNINQEWKYQPIGSISSYGFHESQSRILINQVKPSKIRIEADEVTYNLHIIIRYQIEKALFENEIDVSELPEIWNQKYKDLLGLKIENDSEGIMQDTHWASGYYGYFPSYAIGNVYSGQIFQALNLNVGKVKAQIKEGELKEVNLWLKQNVHYYGSLYEPNELIEKISGEKINAQPYIKYLQEKYKKLYGF